MLEISRFGTGVPSGTSALGLSVGIHEEKLSWSAHIVFKDECPVFLIDIMEDLLWACAELKPYMQHLNKSPQKFTLEVDTTGSSNKLSA